jgi:hypothetical protein
MTLFSNRELLEIPEPEGSDAKEVFAFFGLCSYYAQILEQGLVNLAVGLRIRSLTYLTTRDIDELFHEARRKTLGKLISDVRPHINVSTELENALAVALHDRNYITHQFFVVHDIDFASNRGRMKMLSELREVTRRLQAVDRELESVTHALWERLGLTAQIVQKELAKMEAEAIRLDATS